MLMMKVVVVMMVVVMTMMEKASLGGEGVSVSTQRQMYPLAAHGTTRGGVYRSAHDGSSLANGRKYW
jgi:hypothetical protein